MGRRSAVPMGVLVLAVVGVVMLAPAAALAKGEEAVATGQVTVSGPGLRGPISVSGELSVWDLRTGQPAGNDLASLFGGIPQLATTWSAGRFDAPPASSEELGPRYALTYRIDFDGVHRGGTDVLYPYADGGPLILVPAGAGGAGDRVWWRIRGDSMLQTLRAQGLPLTAPEGPAGEGLPAVDSGRVWIWTLVTLGLAGLVLLAATNARRRTEMAGPQRV
jgi:hypothetical protein